MEVKKKQTRELTEFVFGVFLRQNWDKLYALGSISSNGI